MELTLGAIAVVEMMPVRVVEIVPVRVVEMVPEAVVEIVPVLVVEIVPVLARVVADTVNARVAAHTMYRNVFIILLLVAETSGVHGRLGGFAC